MRAYTIALFLLCIQVAAAIVNTTDVFDYSMDVSYDDEGALQWANTTVQGRSYGNQTLGDEVEYERSAFKDILDFGTAVFRVDSTMRNMGVPATFSWIFAAPVYFIWIFALAQIFLRKGAKDIT